MSLCSPGKGSQVQLIVPVAGQVCGDETGLRPGWKIRVSMVARVRHSPVAAEQVFGGRTGLSRGWDVSLECRVWFGEVPGQVGAWL